MDIPKQFKNYYSHKRKNARDRNIDFLLTIEEAWSLWQPYWEESCKAKTCGYRKYCLSRHGDTGPYSLSNCTIKTHGENSRERWVTNRNSKPGKGNPTFGQLKPRPVLGDGNFYKSITEAGKQTGFDKTTIANRCESVNYPEWQYAPVLSGENL